MRKLTANKAQCGECKDIIESKFRHDWVPCSCGNIFVDGGLDYVRAGAIDFEQFVDLCEYEEDK